jgi:hypothetical protein
MQSAKLILSGIVGAVIGAGVMVAVILVFG